MCTQCNCVCGKAGLDHPPCLKGSVGKTALRYQISLLTLDQIAIYKYHPPLKECCFCLVCCLVDSIGSPWFCELVSRQNPMGDHCEGCSLECSVSVLPVHLLKIPTPLAKLLISQRLVPLQHFRYLLASSTSQKKPWIDRTSMAQGPYRSA